MKTILVMVFALLLGCGGDKQVMESSKGLTVQKKRVIVEKSFDEKTDAYQISSAFTKGTELHISVSYTGGCKDHAFELFTDGSIMKSLPPKQRFFLRHYANQDECESIIERNLIFDLNGTTVAGNTLIVLIDGYKGEIRMEF